MARIKSWSDGKIGMPGRSYLGAVRWLSATLRSRVLTCLAPQSICTDYLTDLVRPGGAFRLGVLLNWGMRTTGCTAQSIEYVDWSDTFYSLTLIDIPKRAGRRLCPLPRRNTNTPVGRFHGPKVAIPPLLGDYEWCY